MYYLAAIASILAVWTLWGYYSSRVEQAEYRVVRAASGYEVREYAAHIEARTTVRGKYSDALREGFRIIASYIFGGNEKRESIAMTAPVQAELAPSEKVAMTAPVFASTGESEEHTIAFVMPRSYTMATLPKPKDARVELVEVPAKTVAVLRFGGYRTPASMKREEEKLRAALARDGITPTGPATYAGYNAPWTPPWLIRNEILIPIAS